MMAEKEVAMEKARRVRCLVFDVDGVLTDGAILLDPEGREWKSFNVRDGLRLVMARRAGLKLVFLTGRSSEAVVRRARELAVDRLFQGISDKGGCLERFCDETGLECEDLGYLGDDLPDLPAMALSGFAAAVADAAPEVLQAADWVARRPGGGGAAGEFAEFILRAQGLWEDSLREAGG